MCQDYGEIEIIARAMNTPPRPCPHCGRERPLGYVTCGRSRCQEASYYANRERNAAKRRRK